MSSASPHARHAPLFEGLVARTRRAALVAAFTCTAACGDDPATASSQSSNYDDEFGDEASRTPVDAGSRDGGPPGSEDGGSEVVVRFVHALVNVGTLYVCHDPDLTVLDDPLTEADEEVPGDEWPSVPLVGLEAAFGVAEPISLPVQTQGMLTVHVRPPPPLEDGGVSFDASTDLDGGDASDAGTLAEACSKETRVAALTLGAETGEPQADAGVPARPTTLTSGPLLLVASGLALDEARLKQRFLDVRAEYLLANPGQDSKADEKGRDAVKLVRDTLGPTLRIEGDAPSYPAATDGGLRISLSQLSPDVVGASPGPGGVRVCVTEGTLEHPVEPPMQAAFRTRVPLTPSFAPELKYRFRVFPANKFDAPPASGGSNTESGAQNCSTTGLAPLAELLVEEKQLLAGQRFDLLFMGAVAPTPLCSPVDEHSLVRPGCPLNPSKLGAFLVLCSTERCFKRAPSMPSTP